MSDWIVRKDRALTDVELFINQFMAQCVVPEYLRTQFRSGYCWHFAHILLDTFERGSVVWTAPFGHVCWEDTDGTVYDIEGEYHGEAYYFIPEDFIMKISPIHMRTFRHLPNDKTITPKGELVRIMQEYCKAYDEIYDSEAESYLKG